MAYSFRKKCFIGQNMNHVHVRNSFLELLIFFWLTQADIYFLKFISHHITDTDQIPKETNHEIKTSIFSCFFHEIKTNIFTCFFNIKLKFLVNKFYFFSVSSYGFMNTFSEAAVRRSSSKKLLLKISQCFELKRDSNRDFFLWILLIF